MPNPPRRPFFQIHLSTAIVLMFVAGALIWANTRFRSGFAAESPVYSHSTMFSPFSPEPSMVVNDGYGWPMIAAFRGLYTNQTHVSGWHYYVGYFIHYLGAIVDLIIALITLFSVWFVCEWLIRRRAARKGA